MRFKIRVIGQGLGLTMMVLWSVWPRSSIEGSLFCTFRKCCYDGGDKPLQQALADFHIFTEMVLWDWAINSCYITRLYFTKTGSTKKWEKSITNEKQLQNDVLLNNIATYIQQSTFSRNIWEPIFHSSFIPWLSAHAIIVGLASFNCHRVLAVFF